MKNKLKIYLGYLFSLAVVIGGIYILWYSINYQKELATKIFNIIGGIFWIPLGCIFGPLFHDYITWENKISEEPIKQPIEEDTVKKKEEVFDIIVKKQVNIKGFLDCANYVEYNAKYSETSLTNLTTSEFKLMSTVILEEIVGAYVDLLRRCYLETN